MMYRKIFINFATILLFTSTAVSQQLAPQKIVPGEWIKSWLICGPFPLKEQKDPALSSEHLDGFKTDYLIKAGGEKNLHVRAGDAVKFKNGSAKWKIYNSIDSIIDLDNAVTKKDPVMAYAYTEIEVEESGIWFLGLGSNDGGSLWINGLKLWDYSLPRGLSVDDNMIPLLLNKGNNKVLLKIEDRGNRWGFCARLLPFSVEKLTERGSLFKITSSLNGEAMIVSDLSVPVLEQLVQKVDIKIVNQQHKVVLHEQRTTGFCGRLNLDPVEYQSYNASVGISLKSGESFIQNLSFYSGKRTDYRLFSEGKSDYRIVLGAEASESEKWAAAELQHWIEEISGVEILFGDYEKAYNGPRIFIGFNDLVKEKTGIESPADMDESFRYFNKGADIFIIGGKSRGSMYGVMAFLENELGCRWYTPGVTVIPKRKELIFNRFDHSEKPGVRVRNDFYFEAFDPVWAARNRMNGSMDSRQQPGGVESYWAVHTFYPLMPPEEFFSAHPEYYSLIDGKRTHDHAQLCLSNPDVLKIITERIKKTISEKPGYLIYDVSQNDCYNPCQCDKCQAIVKSEGSESGIMIWFVNQVAEAVEKEFPDKYIGTLAYQYTRTPPKNIHPRNNVVVRLCSIECCFAHDFKSCPENQSFLRDLQKWSAIAPHMYIWDYVVNFSHYILPYPNFKVLQPNIQTFRENNSIGIMEQAAYQSRGGEFSELRAYLISKLLWDPECNVENVIDDFMYGYYGRAGKFIRQYFNLLQGRITPETHIHLGLSPEDKIFTDQFIYDSYEIFKEAEKVADDNDILRRVEMASLPVLYLKCLRSPLQAKYDGSYADFCRIAEREGVKFYAEAGEPQRISFHKSIENAK
jgi:hypothetical protein